MQVQKFIANYRYIHKLRFQKRPVYAGYGHYGPIKFNQQSIDNTDHLLTNQETKSLFHVPCVSLNDKISDTATNLASTHIDCLNQSQY